jgi:hypothetical protein
MKEHTFNFCDCCFFTKNEFVTAIVTRWFHDSAQHYCKDCWAEIEAVILDKEKSNAKG